MNDEDIHPLDLFKTTAGLVINYYASQFPIFQYAPHFREIGGPENMTFVCDVDNKIDDKFPMIKGETYIRGTNARPHEYLGEVIIWLFLEGILVRKPQNDLPQDRVKPQYQLSAKALDVLGYKDAVFGQTIASKLTEAVKDTSVEVSKNLIAEVIGEFIGGFTKSILR